MAAGVVDDLELVEIQVTQGIRGFASFSAFQRPLEAIFEFPPVDQARQDVVAGVITKPPVEFTRFAHIVEDEHAARDIALPVPYRRRSALNIEFVAVTADQQRGTHRLDRTIAPNRDRQGVLQRLAGLFVKTAKNFVDRAAAGIVDLPSR